MGESGRGRHTSDRAEPQELGLPYESGLDYAEWGHWQEAAVDFQEADKLGSARRVPALALLAAGDVAGYQNACASLLQDFANVDDTAVAARLVWTCCTVPKP